MCTTALVAVLASSVAVQFDGLFTGKTLRFDYYHSGNSTEEHISLEEVRLEGDWPGIVRKANATIEFAIAVGERCGCCYWYRADRYH